MTTFEDLDDDVLYLILEYLYLERSPVLRALRGSSRRLKGFADAVAHRTLLLIDDEVHEQITYRLAERLKDHADQLRYYVRSLRIVNFKGDADSSCLNSALIVECITHIQRLDTFTWDCNQPMSTQILDVLQRFPKAQVCANIALTSRALLNIPQLHRLVVSVSCLDYYYDQRVSLFDDLKQALLRLSSLRHLSVDTHTDDKIFRLQGVSLHRLQIPLEPGDTLPSLVTLQLRSTSYDFDGDHCQRLLESIDCNKLEQLTIASPNPISFFDTFSENLPSLAHLDISYASDVQNDPRHHRLHACSRFLTSLKSLQSLVFRFDNLNLRSPFASVQQSVYAPRLVHLSLLARPASSTGPKFGGNVRKFLWKFTNLKSLKMDFPSIRSYHRCLHCEDSNGEDDFQFSFISPLPSLSDVNLSVRVRSSEQPLITTINKHAHCAIRYLWTTFANKPDSQLETLSVRFWRWETGRTTELKEVFYDTMRLRGRLTIRIRHNRGIPVAVYDEVYEEEEDGLTLVRFEQLDKREKVVESEHSE